MKKMLTTLLSISMLLGLCATAYAATPQMDTSWVPKIPEINFSDEVKQQVQDDMSDYFDEHPIEVEVVFPPEITQATYYHSHWFFSKTRLHVRWEEANNAASYEVRVTKKDGDSKVYSTEHTYLIVNEGADDFVTDCLRSGTIEVRSLNSDGVGSKWSDSETITCNHLHRR